MIEAATRAFIAGRSIEACVDDACRLLSDGLFAAADSPVFASTDIGNACLRAPLPRRAPPGHVTDQPPTGAWVIAELERASRADAERAATSAAGATTAQRPGRTLMLDLAAATASEQSGVRESHETNEARVLTVRVDTETETLPAAGAASQRVQALAEMRELMGRGFHAGAGDASSFLATVARTWLVLTTEPIALEFVLDMQAPETVARGCDIERALLALVSEPFVDASACDATLRRVQNNISRLTVNLFGGCPELAVPITALAPDGRKASAFLSTAATVLFERMDRTATHESLAGFRHNQMLDARLDRARIIVGGCVAVLANEEPERFEHCRSILCATIDEALVALRRQSHTERQLATLRRAAADLAVFAFPDADASDE